MDKRPTTYELYESVETVFTTAVFSTVTEISP